MMSERSLSVLIFVFTLGTLAQPGFGQPQVRFAHDFQTNPGNQLVVLTGGQARYSSSGHLEFEETTKVAIRDKATGPVAKLRLTWTLNPHDKSAQNTASGGINFIRVDKTRPLTGFVVLLVHSSKHGCSIGIRSPNSPKPIGDVVQLKSKSLSWHLLFDFRFGLVRAKAWPVGRPEPKDWTLTRYDRGLTGLRRGAFLISSGKSCRLRLSSLQLGGSAPIPSRRSKRLLTLEILGDQARDRYDFQTAIQRYRELSQLRMNSAEKTDLIGFLRCRHKLADVLTKSRRYDEAQQARFITIDLAKTVGAAHPILAEMYHHLGELLEDLEQFAKAYESFNRAHKIQLKSVGITDIRSWITTNSWSKLLLKMGRGTEARALLEKYIQAAKNQPDLRPHLGSVYCNLGLVLLDQQYWSQAKAMLERSVQFWQDNRDTHMGRFELVRSRLALGELLLASDQHAAAQRTFESAWQELQAMKLPDPLTHGKLESGLGFTLFHLGLKTEGVDLLQKGLKRLQTVFPRGHKTVALALSRLAVTHMQEKRLDQASSLLTQAKNILRKRYGPELGHVHQLHGQLLGQQGKPVQAFQEALAAHNHLVRFYVRSLVTSPTRDHRKIKAAWQPVISQLLALVESRPEIANNHAADLLRTIYDWKAASLRTNRERQITSLLRSPDKQTMDRQIRLRRTLQQLVHLELKRLLVDEQPTDGDQQTDALTKAHQLESDLALLLSNQRLIQAGANFPARVDQVPLAKNSAVVEFLLFEGQSHGATKRRYAAVLTSRLGEAKAKVNFIPLGDADRLDQLIHTWRRSLESGQAEIEKAAEQNLRRILWDPIAAHCRSARHVIIAPDGDIALVPFAALRNANGDYLIETLLISYVTTGRDLVIKRSADNTSTDDRQRILIVGSPTYGTAPSQASQKTKSSIRLQWQPLPQAEREGQTIQSLAKRLRPQWQTQLLKGDQASVEQVMKANSPHTLHITSHAFYFPPGTEEESQFISAGVRNGIALANANHWMTDLQNGKSPGLLVAAQVQQLDLRNTDLVVLSACGTGLGQVEMGEGVLGLRNSFLQAGAASVVSSLWDVDDRVTQTIMTEFYRHWLRGYSKVESLRQAQRIAITQHQQRTGDKLLPLFWAGWVLHGERGRTDPILPALTLPDVAALPAENQPEMATEPAPENTNWTLVVAGLVVAVFAIATVVWRRANRPSSHS